MEIWLGVLGFILMYISDFNQVIWKRRSLKPLFAVGTLSVFINTLFIVLKNLENLQWVSATIIWLIVFFVSFALLVHVLFYAIPFDSSYVEQFSKRNVYKDKAYALTRHPGILPFVTMYISLCFIFPSSAVNTFSIMMIALNIVYVIIQDKYIFTKLFYDYQDYKNETPFLIPTIKSVKRMFTSYRKGE